MDRTVLVNTSSYKIIKANAKSGESMPRHYVTGEGCVIVRKGRGYIAFDDGQRLEAAEGTLIMIPAHRPHQLFITEAFEAFIVLPASADMVFEEK